jgi:hypothetical protein
VRLPGGQGSPALPQIAWREGGLATLIRNRAARTTGSQEPFHPRLSGHRLLVARAAWVVVVLLTAFIFVASVPAHYADLHEICSGKSCVAGQLETGETRALQDLGLSIDVYAAYVLALDIVVALGFCAVGAVIFWCRSQERGALFVSFALIVFGLTWPDTFDTARLHPVWGGLAGFLTQLGLASLFMYFFIFPDGRFVPRWSRWVAPLVFAMPILYILFPGSRLIEPPDPFNILIFLGLWASALLAQVYRYRRVSGTVERQQTKWVVFGATALVVLLIGFLTPLLFFPALDRPGMVSLTYNLIGLTVGGSFGFLLIPLSIGAAILRYRLYDIDVIINRALVYGSLTLTLALTYFGSVALLQYVFRSLTGQETQLTIVASTLAIAALFQPLRRRLQNVIDRHFYRRKYDASRTLEAFSDRLRHKTDLEHLSAELLSLVRETMQPAHVSLWLKPDGAGRSVEQRTR